MIYLLFSAAVHASIAILLLMTSGGSGAFDGDHNGSKRNGQESYVEIIPKPSDSEHSGRSGEGIGKKSKKPKKEEKCDHYYGGVGIQRSYTGETVTEVYKGYPADRAGIKVGDIVLNPQNVIRGEVGSTIRIVVYSNRTTTVYNLIREKICIK